MENLGENSSILTNTGGEEFPISLRQVQPLTHNQLPTGYEASNGQNPHDSNTISIEMEKPDHLSNSTTGIHGQWAITISAGDETTPSFAIDDNRHSAKYHYYERKWKLIYTVALVVMFPALAQLAQLKFQNQKSPFETHTFFAYMAVVAFVVAIPLSVTFFATETYFLETFTNECVSPFYFTYIILRCAFCFSVILAPLALVLVLLVTDGYYWIGYLIISTLFVLVLMYNLIDYLKLRCKKNSSSLGSVQRDEGSFRSIVTSNE